MIVPSMPDWHLANAAHGHERMVENFPSPQVIKAIAEGKQSLPSDPTKRAVYEAQLERYRKKKNRSNRPQTSIRRPAGHLENQSR